MDEKCKVHVESNLTYQQIKKAACSPRNAIFYLILGIELFLSGICIVLFAYDTNLLFGILCIIIACYILLMRLFIIPKNSYKTYAEMEKNGFNKKIYDFYDDYFLTNQNEDTIIYYNEIVDMKEYEDVLVLIKKTREEKILAVISKLHINN